MGLLDSIGGYLGNEENRLRLASGFNNMSGNPNAGNIQTGINQRLKGLSDDRKLKAAQDLATSQATGQRNKTAAMLIAKGGKYAEIGNQLQNGSITFEQARDDYQTLSKFDMEQGVKKPPETFTTSTGADAAEKGLDPTKSYNVSNLTGKISGIGSGGTTIVNEAANAVPDVNELYKILAKDEAEQWGGFLKAGSQAASVIPDITMLGELLQQAPSGPIQGRLAQTFRGFNNAADAAKAIISRLAPSMRVPGSGSTSDIEVQMMMDSLGSLINQQGANALIHAAFKSKLNLDIQRQSIVRRVQSKEITINEGRSELEKLDQVSILSDPLRGYLSQSAAASMQAGGKPTGISQKKWDSMTDKEKALF